MLIQLLSDTHGNHDYVISKQADLIVHAGDFSNTANYTDTEIFVDKCKQLNKQYVWYKQSGGILSVSNLIITSN